MPGQSGGDDGGLLRRHEPGAPGAPGALIERAALLVGGLGLVGFAAAVFELVPVSSAVRDLGLYNLVWVAAVVAISVRAARSVGAGQCLGWAALATGLTANVAANLYYSLVLAHLDTVRTPGRTPGCWCCIPWPT